MSNTKDTITAVKTALSPARIGTYEVATGTVTDDDPRAIALYAWTAQVSAALFAPLHICEVVIRNAVSDALESVHGPRWPWQTGFILSLPSVQHGYSPRDDLRRVAAAQPTTGKVIPELKFVFWEQMFTLRHDLRLWNTHLKRVFPNHDPAKSISALRRGIYEDLEAIRKLRNRIAHHEPVFTISLSSELGRMIRLVNLRSSLVASWMVSNQSASLLVSQPPLFRGGVLWTPSHDEIAKVAYDLWSTAGRSESSSAEADWISAERLLMNL